MLEPSNGDRILRNDSDSTDRNPAQRAAPALLSRRGVPYLREWIEDGDAAVVRVTMTGNPDAAPKVYVGVNVERV